MKKIDKYTEILNDIFFKKDTQVNLAKKHNCSQSYISLIKKKLYSLQIKPIIISEMISCSNCKSIEKLQIIKKSKRNIKILCSNCKINNNDEDKIEEIIKLSYSKEWVSKEELNRLFNDPNINSRDLLLLKVCYYGTLRIGEALNSKVEDFRNEDDYTFLVLYKQKTDKKNWEKQPIPKQLYADIKRYCNDNNILSQHYLFSSRLSERLSYARAYSIIKECAIKAGIDKEITTHTFRRSRIQHLIDDNVDILSVKEIARHKKIDTTRLYLKISKKKLFKKLEEIDKNNIDIFM